MRSALSPGPNPSGGLTHPRGLIRAQGRARAARLSISAGILAVGALVAGCSGSAPPDGPVSTGSATSAVPTPSATSVLPSESVSAVSADDPCGLLTADEINQVLETTFPAGEESTDDARQIATCTFTKMGDVGGVEVPEAIVDVSVSQIDGAKSYDTNVDLAPAYFGDKARPIELPGAKRAYILTNEETESPVVGMLVGDHFVMVQIGVGASDEQALQLATTAAARIS